MNHYDVNDYWNTREDPCSKTINELTPHHLNYIKNQLKDCKQILDFGPGYGRLFSSYENLESVICIDVTSKHLDSLNANAKKYNFDLKLIVKTVDFDKINFSDKFFDAVVTSEVLLHQTPDIVESIMKELIRISKKVIVISYMNTKKSYDKIGKYNKDNRYCFNYDYIKICNNNGWNIINKQRVKNQIMFVYTDLFEFKYEDKSIKFIFDHNDYYMPKFIKNNNTFYEEKYLRYLKDNNIITNESSVVDVGSYLGNHAIYFSKIIGCKKLYCFEPTNESYKILINNLMINNITNSNCYSFGIGSKESKINVYKSSSDNPGSNQYKYTNNGVDCKTLDNLNLLDIQFLKIDVENMEMEVLNGSNELISKCRPIIMIEVGKMNIDKIKEWMIKNKYKRIAKNIFNKNTWLLKGE